MTTFTIESIPGFITRQPVYKLVRNGRCMVDEFYDTIRGDNNLVAQWGDLLEIVEEIANGKMVPVTRYRRIHFSKLIRPTPYEVKSKHLRLYVIHEKASGQILVIGGKKSNQKKDLVRLRQLVKEYVYFGKERT